MSKSKRKEQDDGHSTLKEQNYTVERIVDKRRKNGKIEYLVKWEGFSESVNTWEPKIYLDCDQLVAEYEVAQKQEVRQMRKEAFLASPTFEIVKKNESGITTKPKVKVFKVYSLNCICQFHPQFCLLLVLLTFRNQRVVV